MFHAILILQRDTDTYLQPVSIIVYQNIDTPLIARSLSPPFGIGK
jgi:hypothetical protein